MKEPQKLITRISQVRQVGLSQPSLGLEIYAVILS